MVFGISGNSQPKMRYVNGEKQQIFKKDGKYYVKDSEGNSIEVKKTKKRSLFGKAQFSKVSVPANSSTNAQQNQQTKISQTQVKPNEQRAAVHQNEVNDVAKMKEQAAQSPEAEPQVSQKTRKQIIKKIENKETTKAHTPDLSGFKGTTVSELRNEISEAWRSQGGGPLKAMIGEKQNGVWYFPKNHMVCRDASGRTQNIEGKLTLVHDAYEKNPDAFTITDTSSGEAHEYLFKKINVDTKGNPIYKAVSMNGKELVENQYTLNWVDDKSPELVQYEPQDNYGSGLRIKDSSKVVKKPKPKAKDDAVDSTAPKKDSYITDKKPRQKVPPKAPTRPDNRNSGDKPNKVIWINVMPGPTLPGQPKLSREQKIDSAVKGKLSPGEQQQYNKCKGEAAKIAYLKSIGIDVKFAH